MLLAGVVPNLTAVIAEFVANAASPISTMLSGILTSTVLLLNLLLKASFLMVFIPSIAGIFKIILSALFTLSRPAWLKPVISVPDVVKSVLSPIVTEVYAFTIILKFDVAENKFAPSEFDVGVSIETALVVAKATAKAPA